MLSIFSKGALSRIYALFVGLLSGREPLLAVIVQDSKMLLQSRQAASLFLRLSPTAILILQSSFLTRLSYRSTNDFASQTTERKNIRGFAI
jgi:hypothetical protein